MGAFSANRAILLAAMIWFFVLCLVSPGYSASSSTRPIAILKTADITPYNDAIAGFKDAMGSSAQYVEYDLQGDLLRGRKLAREIRDSNPSLILAVGLKAALAAKEEIHKIPVVFCMVLNPMKHSLTAPNMTGILLEVPVERQFDAIDDVLPTLKRLGVLYDPDKSDALVRKARRYARQQKWTLIERRIAIEKDVPSAARAILRKVDALWLVPDSTVLTKESFQFLLQTALDHNVPVIGFSSEFVRSGALMGISASYPNMGYQAGTVARNILNGRDYSQEAVISPDQVTLALNLNTARFLGIIIPPYVVSTADELY